MQNVTFVAYRYLTNADFFNIYKPEGTEGAGGGQTYIDFPAGDITLKDWQEFFDGAEGVEIKQRTYGPAWTFRLNSLGLTGAEDLTIYQRRKQSFTIASQRLGSRHSNRPRAWHPDYGFPEPVDPEDRQALPSALAIYLVRSDQGEFWAGWFQDREPSRDDPSKETLSNMLVSDPSEGQTGFIRIADAKLLFDQWDSVTPFLSDDAVQAKNWEAEIAILKIEEAKEPPLDAAEEQISAALLDQDMLEGGDDTPKGTSEWRSVRKRNEKAVRLLKRLYGGQCQITGDQYTFTKRDGMLYSEAHHVIPLGEEGSDSPQNIIIVSPLVHKMLHYAEVSVIDLANIGPDDSLPITINGVPYVIRWHPMHAKIVRGQVG